MKEECDDDERAGWKCNIAAGDDGNDHEIAEEGDSPVLGGRRKKRSRESGDRSKRHKEKRRSTTSVRETARLLLPVADFRDDADGQTGREPNAELPQTSSDGKEKDPAEMHEVDSHPLAAFGFARKEAVQKDVESGLGAKQDERQGSRQGFAGRDGHHQRKEPRGAVDGEEMSGAEEETVDGDARLEDLDSSHTELGEEDAHYMASQGEADIRFEKRGEERAEHKSRVSVDKLANSKARSDSGDEGNPIEEQAEREREREREQEFWQKSGSWGQSMPESEAAQNQKAVQRERGLDQGLRRALSTAGLNGGGGEAGPMKAPDRVSGGGLRRSVTFSAPDRVTGGGIRPSIVGSVLGGDANRSRGEFEGGAANGGADKARQQIKRCVTLPSNRWGACRDACA